MFNRIIWKKNSVAATFKIVPSHDQNIGVPLHCIRTLPEDVDDNIFSIRSRNSTIFHIEHLSVPLATVNVILATQFGDDLTKKELVVNRIELFLIRLKY